MVLILKKGTFFIGTPLIAKVHINFMNIHIPKKKHLLKLRL